MQPDRVPVGVPLALRLAETDRRPAPAQGPDRPPPLALDLAEHIPAERAEQVAVERQAALDRGDDEVDVMDAAGAHVIRPDFGVGGASPRTIRPVHLFHYHLVTSRVREVEARYIGKLGFDLVAGHGRMGEDLQSYEPGISWAELDTLGFKLRLSELELGAVNVVVQPGQWPLPRVDHLGLSLDEDEFERAIARADRGRPTFVSTNVGYRLELPPPRDWIDDLIGQADRLRLSEIHLKSDDPLGKADALAHVLGCERIGPEVEVGDTLVRFTPGGPQGRPELEAEMFV